MFIDIFIKRVKHKDNKAVVLFPGKGFRVRNCQSTVIPTAPAMWPVRDINDWFLYIRAISDAHYRATKAIDLSLGAEKALYEAKKLIHQA